MKKFTAALFAACLLVCVLSPVGANAHTKGTSWSHRILHDYYSVVRKLGKRAAGREIIRHGIRVNGKVRPATKHEKAKFQRQLRKLLAPPPYHPLLQRTAVPPTQLPAGTASAGITVGSDHMACIIRKESGGNPKAGNGQYHGIGQWSPESWARNGGHRYASDPWGATYEQQLMVLAGEGDAGMSREQGQYDGCG